jgi:predicted hydrocarbon binding protein
MARSTYGATTVNVQWRQWRGAVDLRSSLFCEVRDRVDHPLCEYYASALRRLLHLFELDADVMTDRCRATTGAPLCTLSVVVRPNGAASAAP